MSSAPFCLGLPVVDVLKETDRHAILRAKDRQDAWYKIRDFQKKLPYDETIAVYEIGQRPDSPVPVARHFSEIMVIPEQDRRSGIGGCNLIWGYMHVIHGLKDYEMR